MHITVTTDSLVTDGVLKLLFKEFIYEKATKEAYKMSQKADRYCRTPTTKVVITPKTTTPKALITKTTATTTTKLTSQNVKPTQMTNVAAKAKKSKITETICENVFIYESSPKKLAVYQLLDAIPENSDSDSENEEES